MIFKNLVSFILAARYWIATSLAGSLTAGVVVAFFFNPYVVNYRIKNIGGYFDIETLKSTKLQAASLSDGVLSKITDPTRKDTLSKMIGRSEWLENNITPVFAITKSDLRDLPESQIAKNQVVGNVMSYVNFKQNADDEALARANLNFVAAYILNVVHRERLLNWLNATKNNYQQILLDVAQQLPNISLVLTSNRERVEAVKNIIATSPNAAKNAQLYLSMNQGQGNNNNNNNNNNNTRMPINNEDLTAFISPEIQLSGLQINQAYLTETLNQLRFKREVSEYLVDLAGEGQNLINQLNLSPLSDLPDLPHDFWRQGKILDLLKKEQDWRLEYVENTVKGLELQQKQFSLAHEIIARQVQLVDNDRKFSRLLVIVVSLLIGIMVPLVVFFMMQIKGEEK